jgi:Zinc knuckle
MNPVRKGCFKCGNCTSTCSLSFPCTGSVPTIDMFLIASIVGHHADSCTATERLCYNCRQPGHQSSACPSPRSASAKQCYSCGGVGHIQVDCPTLRIQSMNAGGAQKCYVGLGLIPPESSINDVNSIAVVLGTFLASALLPRVVRSVRASVLALPRQGQRPSNASDVVG